MGTWPHRTAVPNTSGVSAPIIRNSHPVKIAVAIAIRAKSRLVRAPGRRHQTRKCTRASVRQADAIIDQTMVTQFIVRNGLEFAAGLTCRGRSSAPQIRSPIETGNFHLSGSGNINNKVDQYGPARKRLTQTPLYAGRPKGFPYLPYGP